MGLQSVLEVRPKVRREAMVCRNEGGVHFEGTLDNIKVFMLFLTNSVRWENGFHFS